MLTLLITAALLLVIIMTGILVRGARHPRRRTLAYALARDLAPEPAALDLPHDSWWLDVRGGRLPVWEMEGRGAGPTCVLVHGWAQARVDALARIETFLPHFERVVVYDLRGHGEADAGPSRLGADEEHDLLVLLERLGSNRTALIGWSMGAVVAIHAAARAPERVCGVLAEAPYDSFAQSLRRRLRASELPALGLPDLALLWFRARGLRFRRTTESAASLGCPLLVVHGTEDRIASIDDGRRIAAAATLGSIIESEGGAHADPSFRSGPTYDAIVGTFARCSHEGRRIEFAHDATADRSNRCLEQEEDDEAPHEEEDVAAVADEDRPGEDATRT